MSYRVLALDKYSMHMSLPVLRRIRDLVKDGAVVVGGKPVNTPSLSDDDKEFHNIADELWGNGTGEHNVGKGKVYAGQTLAAAFTAMKLAPDFDYTKPQSDTHVIFVHRKLADGDLYFVDNRNDREEQIDATFRVTGKAAEVWHAETGTSEAASYTIVGGHTTVPLHLDPWGAVFVIFRKAAKNTSYTLPKSVETKVVTVEGSWKVAFQAGRGAPETITLDKLTSWSENADSGVKYFSGAGTYSKTIDAPRDWFKRGSHLWIDLGDVKNLAEVTVNGKPLGNRLAHALPGGRDGRTETRRERNNGQGDQRVGKPIDR